MVKLSKFETILSTQHIPDYLYSKKFWTGIFSKPNNQRPCITYNMVNFSTLKGTQVCYMSAANEGISLLKNDMKCIILKLN